MFTRRPSRLKAFHYLGLHRYFLTFCTNHRLPLFTARESVDLVLSQILRAASEQRFAVPAYCFMPDHVHLLVEGLSEHADGRRFIVRAKQYSGFHYRKAFGHQLWQQYGYERILRSDEGVLSVARYILENPLRAGLVERVADYPFLGSTVHSLDEIVEAVQLSAGWARRG